MVRVGRAAERPATIPGDVVEVVEFVIGRPRHVHLDDLRLRPTSNARNLWIAG